MSTIKGDAGAPSWIERPPTADELPCDDREPLETQRHRDQMNLLIDPLNDFWADRNDFYAGGNMFLYYSLRQVRNNDFRGPDVFVVMDTTRRERKSWVVWEEDGRVPDLVIELLSESTAAVDRGEKKRIYERVLHVSEYFLYDPFGDDVEGYRLGEQGYRMLERNAAGRLPSTRLGLELGLWQGTDNGVEARWLRWFTPEGAVVPTASERAAVAEQRATAAEQRAADVGSRLEAYERRFGPLPEGK